MKTIVYGKRNGEYECLRIEKRADASSPTFAFEEPISGKLVIGSYLLSVENGVTCEDISELKDGEYTPVLFCGNYPIRLEPIIVLDGGVLRKAADDEYIRRLGGICDALCRRLDETELALAEIKRGINEAISL